MRLAKRHSLANPHKIVPVDNSSLEPANFPVRQPHDTFKMTKRTKKVGITGKYGTRYGASLRKQVKKMEVSTISPRYSGIFALSVGRNHHANVRNKIDHTARPVIEPQQRKRRKNNLEEPHTDRME